MQTIETVIGVVLVFLAFSLVVSAARELVAGVFGLRRRALKSGLDALLLNLGDQSLVTSFWSHPFIKSLQPANRTPSYIPLHTISATLLHIAGGSSVGKAVEASALKGNLSNTPHKGLSLIVATAMEESGANPTISDIESSLEKWAQASLQRITSDYQRKTRVWLFLVALVLSAILNLDAVTLWQRVQSERLLRETLLAHTGQAPTPDADPGGNVSGLNLEVINVTARLEVARKQLSELDQTEANPNRQTQLNSIVESIVGAENEVKVAEKKAEDAAKATQRRYRDQVKAYAEIEVPIGWNEEAIAQYRTLSGIVLHGFGLLASALAISLGAPFCFDLLQRFVNVRTAQKPLWKPAK